MLRPEEVLDVLIVGSGVTGSSVAKNLGRYSNVRKVACLERNQRAGMVNSHPLNNAQTSHDGGTETNTDKSHAIELRNKALALRSYVRSKNKPGLYRVTTRMALAVGAKEVRLLEERYEMLKDYFSDLRLVYGQELAEIEPMVMKGRNPHAVVCGLVSNEGYAVNYQMLAECMLEDAQVYNLDFKIYFGQEVKNIRRERGLYILQTQNRIFRAKTLMVAAGAYSLFFAQKLGHGLDYGILSVAGSFYSSKNFVRGKVYPPQDKDKPFARPHADADMLNPEDTRLGPTTQPIPLMERHRWGTFWDYIQLPLISTLPGVWAAFKVIFSRKFFWYGVKNYLYIYLPVIGRYMFLKQVQKMIPTMKYRDLKLRRGAGGVRPQIVNIKTKKLEMEESTIVADYAIFSTTPSPGASVSEYNGAVYAHAIVGWLGEGYHFDVEDFERDSGSKFIPLSKSLFVTATEAR